MWFITLRVKLILKKFN